MKTSHWHRTHAPARPEPGLPRPAAALLPYAAILAWTGMLVLSHAIALRWAAALAASAALAGGCAWAWASARRSQMCNRADRFIATGAGQAPPDAVLGERRAELVGRRQRRMLAATVRRIVESAQAPPMRSARVPLDRRAVCAEAPRLTQLAATLAATDVPVSARGVARTYVLVTDARSPVYRHSRDGAAELHRQLIQTLFELERGVNR